MECTIQTEGDCYVISLKGDFLVEESPATRKIFFDCIDDGHSVLADMSGVDYIDSSGIASLVEAYHCTIRRGVGFGIVCPSKGVIMVLELVRLDKVFPLFNSLEDGLQAVH